MLEADQVYFDVLSTARANNGMLSMDQSCFLMLNTHRELLINKCYTGDKSLLMKMMQDLYQEATNTLEPVSVAETTCVQ